MITKNCLNCHTDFQVPNHRDSAKFCSRKCSETFPRSVNNAICNYCGKEFHKKPSQIAKNTGKLGIFCSTLCLAETKRIAYEGDKNPNYKGKNTDTDGYRTVSPSARKSLGHTMKRLHQVVCCEVLGVKTIPLGLHVHHRDCNPMNNVPENLAVLSISDHKWIHKQFGVAPLWAYSRGLISLESLVSWSDDQERAKRLLPLNVLKQNSDGEREKLGMTRHLQGFDNDLKVQFVEASTLSETDRGSGGFGSTGV